MSKEILADPEGDAALFATFREVLLGKEPGLTEEELRARWVELKRDAGL